MSKQKRIIFTVTNDLNFDQRMQRICTSLSKAGYEVLLIGRKRSVSRPLKDQVFDQKRIRCFINSGPLFYAEYNLRLFFLLLFSKFDIVCGVDLDTLLAAWMSSILKRKKVCYDAHEYFPESPELEGRLQVKKVWTKLESILIRRVDSVYTVSEGIKLIFEDQYSVKVRLVRNLPNLSHYTSQPQERPYIIYQGALNVGRGLKEMIQIMPELDCDLWLAGEGDMSGELRTLAIELASDKIKFLGNVDPDKLKQITANAIIGINLLEPLGMSYQLSLSNKFFDYIMAEIPQICIDFDEYRRINRELSIAVLVPNLKKESLLNAVESLLNDEINYRQLKLNCRQMKSIYNWEHEEKQLLKIYESV